MFSPTMELEFLFCFYFSGRRLLQPSLCHRVSNNRPIWRRHWKVHYKPNLEFKRRHLNFVTPMLLVRYKKYLRPNWGGFFESKVRTKFALSSCYSNMGFSITDLVTSSCYSREKFVTFKAHFFSIPKIQTDLVLFSCFQCHEHVTNLVWPSKNPPQLHQPIFTRP